MEQVSPDCAPLVEVVADFVRAGKRLRPAFCYWGWRGAGGPDCEPIVAAAATLELFQAAALIHDDLMDDSDTRRGMPSVHRRFAMLHRGSGWVGEPRRFGLAGAVLTGDLCLVWCDQMLTDSGLDLDRLARGRPAFDRMRTELMAGQYLDMREQALAGQAGAVERARRVIMFKSAKYTVEEPLLLGGALAGAPPSLLADYSAFGLPLGEAFQLRDDLLGVFGDPEQTGKPAGDDLREGKRTVLVASALERATPVQAGAGGPPPRGSWAGLRRRRGPALGDRRDRRPGRGRANDRRSGRRGPAGPRPQRGRRRRPRGARAAGRRRDRALRVSRRGRVRGPSHHVVVVGAGLAGLSARCGWPLRAPGHGARAGGGARRPGRRTGQPGLRRGVPVRRRPDRADDARDRCRLLRLPRRADRGLGAAAAGLAGLPGPLRRRQPAGRARGRRG
jgi:geranylgeranyl diphosphate synthase type I